MVASSSSVLVGARTFRLSTGACVRVFYPATTPSAEKLRPASWFRTSLGFVVDGYVHAVLGGASRQLRAGRLVFRLASWTIQLCAWLVTGRKKLENTFDEAPAAIAPSSPVLLWSHGLLGCGDEHALMAKELASRGMVVGLLHHADGSSAKLDTQPAMYYEHPDFTAYDSSLRQRGAEVRAKEVEEAYDIVMKHFDQLGRVCVGGFSYGAATAALLAATQPKKYVAALLIDGWFHIEIKGCHIDLPKQAFDNGIAIPALFLGSEAFGNVQSLADATDRLQRKCTRLDRVERIQGSTHATFMEACFWCPPWFARVLGLVKESDPRETYLTQVDTMADFIIRHAQA